MVDSKITDYSLATLLDATTDLLEVVQGGANKKVSPSLIAINTLDGTTPLSVAKGGTGGTTAATARAGISAAELGTNSDITAITGLLTALSVAQGGTGGTSAGAARTNLGLVIGTDVQAFLTSITDGALGITIDGGGSAITTGIKGYLEIPWNCTITTATVLLDQSGSIVIDVWRDTYANYPPTVADTITASALPTVTTATKSQDATLTGWSKTCTKGDVLGFNVNSATTTTRAHLSLRVTKT